MRSDVVTAAVACVLAAPLAFAQAFPERTRFIVPLAPGGGNDAAARVIAGLAQDSALPAPETPAAFARFLAGEQKKWAPVVKQAGRTAF